MKRIFLFFFVGFSAWPMVFGQPSFSEKRLRDKAYNEGITHVLQSQYELASASFTQCTDLDSTFAPAWLMQGRIYLEWGAMDEALNFVDLALSYDPGLGEAYFYKGYLLYESDTTGMDRGLFEQAISQGFRNAWAYYFRAITEIRDGKNEAALNDLNTAIEINESFALAYHERAGLKRLNGDLQGSHFDYSQAVKFQPDFALAYNNMGSVKILMGDYMGAIADYSKALELDPGLFMALNNRGYARYYTEDADGALKDFNAAITNSESFSYPRLNKASLLAGQGQLEEALSLLDGVMEENPDDALLFLNRGLIRELTGDPDGACADWAKALELGAEEAVEYVKECGR
jgi:tetratricopeptide (TPR) repeat protein